MQCGGRSGARTGFLQLLQFSPVIISPQVLHNRLRLNGTLSEEQAGTAWEPSEKAVMCYRSGTVAFKLLT